MAEGRLRRLLLGTTRRLVAGTINRHQLRSAGQVGARAALVRHVGRTSGRAYETPVTPTPTEDGFVIALPYGERADWVRNVLAAGGAVLVREGVEYRLTQPQVLPMNAVVCYIVPGDRRMHRRFGVDRCLRVVAEPAA